MLTSLPVSRPLGVQQANLLGKTASGVGVGSENAQPNLQQQAPLHSRGPSVDKHGQLLPAGFDAADKENNSAMLLGGGASRVTRRPTLLASSATSCAGPHAGPTVNMMPSQPACTTLGQKARRVLQDISG